MLILFHHWHSLLVPIPTSPDRIFQRIDDSFTSNGVWVPARRLWRLFEVDYSDGTVLAAMEALDWFTIVFRLFGLLLVKRDWYLWGKWFLQFYEVSFSFFILLAQRLSNHIPLNLFLPLLSIDLVDVLGVQTLWNDLISVPSALLERLQFRVQQIVNFLQILTIFNWLAHAFAMNSFLLLAAACLYLR